MKKIFTSTMLLLAFQGLMAQTQLTVTIDTKLMGNFNCNLNGDGVNPAPVNKVYMHSGACSENRGSNQSQSAEAYCADQIVPYASDVWQHVVGNWGDNPQDDGVGQMTDDGDGVYHKTFIVEDYYSDPNLVSTEQNSTGTTVSAPMDPNNTVYLIGLVFRNEDATASGRDQQGCNDIFIINFNTDNPTIINSTDNSVCQYVSMDKSVGIEDRSAVSRFSFGPNPATDQIRFELDLRSAGRVSFDMCNMLGELVQHDELTTVAGRNRYEADVTGLPAGIYTVSFNDSAHLLAQQRMVVSH